MPVNKFGHFTVSTNNSLKRHASKNFGFILDGDRNINVQNKRIKNVSSPVNDKDVVTKVFFDTEVGGIQADFLDTINSVAEDIKKKISDITKDTSALKSSIDEHDVKIDKINADVITKDFLKKEIVQLHTDVGYTMEKLTDQASKNFADTSRKLKEYIDSQIKILRESDDFYGYK